MGIKEAKLKCGYFLDYCSIHLSDNDDGSGWGSFLGSVVGDTGHASVELTEVGKAYSAILW